MWQGEAGCLAFFYRRRVAPVPAILPSNPDVGSDVLDLMGAPGPSLLGTGDGSKKTPAKSHSQGPHSPVTVAFQAS